MQLQGIRMSTRVRFAGQEQQDRYYAWLDGMPRRSKVRILHIDDVQKAEGKEGPKHIGTALYYGAKDKHVRALNREIIGLVKARNQERKQKVENGPAAEKLQDLRVALNRLLTPLREAHGSNGLPPWLVRGVLSVVSLFTWWRKAPPSPPPPANG